jgi:tripartite ATP-independent transporter DctM subunit
LDPLIIALLGIGALLVLLGIGVPIAFSMTVVGIAGLLITTGPDITWASLQMLPMSSIASYGLVLIPLFVLMGNFANVAGISRDLYDTAYKWFGRLPGGLAIATVFASAALSACTGSSVAMVATMSKIALPQMDRYNYKRELSLGSVAGAGTLDILIPPSIIAVIYAIITESSVGKVLVGGIIPGLINAGGFIVMILIRAMLNPSLGPRAAGITWLDSLKAIKGVWGMIVLFGTFMGVIYTGITTPTEAGAIGCVCALVLAAVTRNLNWSAVRSALFETIRTGTMILTIIIGAQIFTLFLTRSGFAERFVGLALGLDISPTTLVILFLLMYVPLGMFFEPMSMLLLTLPITYPVLQQVGVDGVWYGILVILMVQLGLLTPPVGLCVYVLKGAVPDTPLMVIFKSTFWFAIVICLVVVVLIIFPDLVLWLPRMMSRQ